MTMEQTYKNKRIQDRCRIMLIVMISMIAIFQSGMRDLKNLPDGNDTPNYQTKYEDLRNKPLSSVMSDFSIISTDYSERDTGYEVFMKLTQYICNDFRFFMFLTTILFFLFFARLIYKYVKSYLGIILVFMIFFAIFTNIVNSFMRQAITLSITLFAVKYIIKRNWKFYYGLMLIALSIHSSAIAAFPFYFLPWFSKSKKWLFLSLVASPILILFFQKLMSYFLAGSVYEIYVEEEMVNPVNYMALVVSIVILALLFYKHVRMIKDSEILISSAIGTMIFLPVVFMGNTFLRISYYYVLILLLLLPNIIDRIKIPPILRLTAYSFLISFFIFLMYKA